MASRGTKRPAAAAAPPAAGQKSIMSFFGGGATLTSAAPPVKAPEQPQSDKPVVEAVPKADGDVDTTPSVVEPVDGDVDTRSEASAPASPSTKSSTQVAPVKAATTVATATAVATAKRRRVVTDSDDEDTEMTPAAATSQTATAEAASPTPTLSAPTASQASASDKTTSADSDTEGFHPARDSDSEDDKHESDNEADEAPAAETPEVPTTKAKATTKSKTAKPTATKAPVTKSVPTGKAAMSSFFGGGAVAAAAGATPAAGAAVVASAAPKPEDRLLSKLGAIRFHPVNDAGWKAGEPVPYKALVDVFTYIESVSGRLKIQSALCNFFRSIISLSPQDLLLVVYLCCNRLAPAYQGIELGIGDSLLIKAICGSTGRSAREIKAELNERGDLGLIAESSRSTQGMLFRPKALSVRKVYETFLEIAHSSGNKSMEKKVSKIQAMLVACQDNEARYIVRGLQGKLRIGLAEKTVLVALAHAVVLTPPSSVLPPAVLDASETMSPEALAAAQERAVVMIKQVYSEVPSYELVLPALLSGGLDAMREQCHLQPGIPVEPMLAKPSKGIQEVLARFTNILFTCEWKYDGERAQIHCLPDGTVKVFSRNSEDTSSKYPDLVETVKAARADTTTSFVLDGEAVAYDCAQHRLLPFQILSTRARKGATLESIKINVIYCAFDILYLNGKSMLKVPLKERREALYSAFKVVEDRFKFADHLECSDVEQLEVYLQDAVKGNCEGLMIKTLVEDATYEPSKRSLNWLKLKKDYMDGLTDSLDLVPIAAYYGKGKRTGTFGAYLLACFDEDEEVYQSVCKIGTGFSDEALASHTAFFKDNGHILDSQPHNVQVGAGLEPDVWLAPVQVWEVLAADLSISPVHMAAAGKIDPTKGIALRFPRFIRIRDDKKPEGCTNSDQVAQMYRDQGLTQATAAAGNDDSDDDDCL